MRKSIIDAIQAEEEHQTLKLAPTQEWYGYLKGYDTTSAGTYKRLLTSFTGILQMEKSFFCMESSFRLRQTLMLSWDKIKPSRLLCYFEIEVWYLFLRHSRT